MMLNWRIRRGNGKFRICGFVSRRILLLLFRGGISKQPERCPRNGRGTNLLWTNDFRGGRGLWKWGLNGWDEWGVNEYLTYVVNISVVLVGGDDMAGGRKNVLVYLNGSCRISCWFLTFAANFPRRPKLQPYSAS